MTHREGLFGKNNYVPEVSKNFSSLNLLQGSIDHLFPGTFYLTKVDNKYRRYYEIKDPDSQEQSLTFNWTGDLLKPQKTAVVDNSSEIEASPVLNRLNQLDNHFTS